MSFNNDCSDDLTAEHYVSESLLEQLGHEIEVRGTPWLSPGETRRLGIRNLTARILCARHNSALSPLDSEAQEFFLRLHEINEDLHRKSISMRSTARLLSGELLELWALKTICGLFFGRNAAQDGVRLIDTHLVEQRLIADAFFGNTWQPGCGLYVQGSAGHSVVIVDSISLAPSVATGEQRLVGGQIRVGGIGFEMLFDPIGVNPAELRKDGWIHRPTELSFSNNHRSHSLILTWATGAREHAIRMKLSGRSNPKKV